MVIDSAPDHKQIYINKFINYFHVLQIIITDFNQCLRHNSSKCQSYNKNKLRFKYIERVSLINFFKLITGKELKKIGAGLRA